MTSPSHHDVLGTTITMPVEIRTARCFVAAFTADATVMQSAIDAAGGSRSTGLAPMRIRADRGICTLVFVDYVDGDLGPYNEFGVCFLVENNAEKSTADSASKSRPWRSLIAGDARALIHRLPVDGEFTLAAGRGIWGFPKTLADFDVDHDSSTRHGRVSADDKLIVDLTVKPGIPVPSSSADTTLHAYSQLDGVTRETPWQLHSLAGTRSRVGGAQLQLGDHPIAEELRSLRLSKRALMTSSVQHLSMVFGDAHEVAH